MQVMLHQFSFYKSVDLIINLDFYLCSDTIIDLNDFDKNVSSSISNLSEKTKVPGMQFSFFQRKIFGHLQISFFVLSSLPTNRSKLQQQRTTTATTAAETTTTATWPIQGQTTHAGRRGEAGLLSAGQHPQIVAHYFVQ